MACLALSAICALGLPGCATQSATPSPTAIRVGAATATSAGRAGAVVGFDYLTAALVREALGTIGPDGRVAPRLAERWEVSADGRTWSFHLRPNLTFHDGTAVTSAVVAPLLRARLTGLSQVTSVVSEGDLLVRVELPRATPFLLEEVAFGSIGLGANSTVGTGPFQLAESRDGKIRFEAFQDYRMGAPEIREVTLTQYQNLRSAWSAMMRDEVDVLYDVSDDAREFVRAETSVDVAAFLRPYVYLLGLNHQRRPFQDVDVRRALNLAIDRTMAIEQGLRGSGEPAYDHLWPFHWAVDAERSRISFDRGRAKRILDATYPVKTTAGRMPARFSFTCLVYEPFERLGLVIQRQLADVGIDMRLELVPLEVLAPRAVSGDYDAFIFEMASARSLSFPYLFWHSSTPPRTVPSSGYTGADGPLDRIRYATTDDEIRSGVAALQDVFRDNPPAVFIAWSESARAVSRRFDIPEAPGEDVFHSIARWKAVVPNGTHQP